MYNDDLDKHDAAAATIPRGMKEHKLATSRLGAKAVTFISFGVQLREKKKVKKMRAIRQERAYF